MSYYTCEFIYEPGTNIVIEELWLDYQGNFHNPKGPFRTTYYSNGNKKSEYWESDRNRSVPRYVRYDKNGNVETSRWYIDNDVVSFDEWLERCDLSYEQKVDFKLRYG